MEGLLDPEMAFRWLPVVLLGAAMVVAVRLTGNPLAVPATMALAVAAFYLWLALAGIDLDEAGRRGLLLGPFGPGAGLASTFDPGLLARADYGEILREAPAIANLVGLGLIGAILNASGLDATGEAVDVNRDLRGVGLANLAAGAGGGLAGYHILGETLLARRLVGPDARWIGVTVGIAYAAALLAGPSLLSVLPTGVFAALLAFLGIDLLYDWLWVERRRMPAQDFAIVLLIVVAAASIGFLEAVAIGVFAASIVFVLAYSRFDVVRACVPAALRPSMTERSETAMRQLAQAGARTLVFELQGYVFFGTAHALYSRFNREVAGRPELDRVVLDFRRVQGLDVSAAFNLGKLEQDCRGRGSSSGSAGPARTSAGRSTSPA